MDLPLQVQAVFTRTLRPGKRRDALLARNRGRYPALQAREGGCHELGPRVLPGVAEHVLEDVKSAIPCQEVRDPEAAAPAWLVGT